MQAATELCLQNEWDISEEKIMHLFAESVMQKVAADSNMKRWQNLAKKKRRHEDPLMGVLKEWLFKNWHRYLG